MATINGSNGNDHLRGTAASDRMNGRGGNDTLEGSGGNDTLDGGSGDDRLAGGAGRDTYIVDSEGDSIVDSSGRDTVVALVAYYALGAGLENLTLRGNWFEVQGDGNELDNVIRNDRADGGAWIDGADGDDTLLGGDGWDVFSFNQGSGNYGNDVVDGGGGDDGIRTGAHSAVVVDFRDGNVTGGGASGSGTIAFSNIEFAAGGNFDDTLIANDAGIRLYGGDGNDVLVGGAGNDTLLSDNDGSDGGQSPFIAGRDSVTGGAGNDRIETAGGNDTLDGGAGADTLIAGNGDDTLFWQASDTVVDGGDGNDILRLRSGSLKLTAIDNATIQDIETVNMSNGGDNRLTLSAQDILDLSSTTDTLRVLGGSGDSVNIVGAFVDEGVSGGYHRYSVGSATLLIDTDITSVF
jgi:Ca2+-binding RTX toxin-like protein